MGNLKFPSVTWMLLDDLLTSWIGKATKTNYKYWFLENARSKSMSFDIEMVYSWDDLWVSPF